jgi:hypothetical protein
MQLFVLIDEEWNIMFASGHDAEMVVDEKPILVQVEKADPASVPGEVPARLPVLVELAVVAVPFPVLVALARALPLIAQRIS